MNAKDPPAIGCNLAPRQAEDAEDAGSTVREACSANKSASARSNAHPLSLAVCKSLAQDQEETASAEAAFLDRETSFASFCRAFSSSSTSSSLPDGDDEDIALNALGATAQELYRANPYLRNFKRPTSPFSSKNGAASDDRGDTCILSRTFSSSARPLSAQWTSHEPHGSNTWPRRRGRGVLSSIALHDVDVAGAVTACQCASPQP
eukprot:Tamp_24017.p2 GENE.Tamp_24017~~Tamp_24017.p2  ORF type:complete len:206 (-),score=15.78 Tamp_24017:279-896(-)